MASPTGATWVGACACSRTGSFGPGATLVAAIARVADGHDHHPGVDLQFATVTVRV